MQRWSSSFSEQPTAIPGGGHGEVGRNLETWKKWEPPAAVTEADLEVADAGAEGATKGGKEEASETEEAPASPDP